MQNWIRVYFYLHGTKLENRHFMNFIFPAKFTIDLSVFPERILHNSVLAKFMSARAIGLKIIPVLDCTRLLIRSYFSTLLPSSKITTLSTNFLLPFSVSSRLLREIGELRFILTAVFGFTWPWCMNQYYPVLSVAWWEFFHLRFSSGQLTYCLLQLDQC